MPISLLMKSPVLSVGMDETVEAIEDFMRGNDLSWVPVRGPDGAIVGVVSASDLLQFHELKKDPATVCAWQVCTYKPIMVPANTPVADVARLMVENRIHHVVVTEFETVVGVVSSLDFVRRFATGDAPSGGQPA
jgi:CBS domain-containing protein